MGCPKAKDNPTTSANASCALRRSKIRTGDVRFGSKADIARDQLNVRFAPKSGHRWQQSTSATIAGIGEFSPVVDVG
jgi:hypothetical protein